MNMPRITLLVGVLLVIEGLGFYVGTGTKSITALIPTVVGLPILVLGILAFSASGRRHAMHLAAALAAIGFLAAVGRMVQAGLSVSPASASVLILALLTGGFLVLCVNSFADARRRRRQGL
jgi:peptidoglycan/LPS O-acetylase OafA/YrhL